jgi:hypothetical protein
MAVFAPIRRCNMIRCFADCFGTVVAANTVSGDPAVIKSCPRKCRCRVTVFTPITRLRVIAWFANRFYSVMTRGAGLADTAVVKLGNHPVARSVACVAFGLRRNMISRFAA